MRDSCELFHTHRSIWVYMLSTWFPIFFWNSLILILLLRDFNFVYLLATAFHTFISFSELAIEELGYLMLPSTLSTFRDFLLNHYWLVLIVRLDFWRFFIDVKSNFSHSPPILWREDYACSISSDSRAISSANMRCVTVIRAMHLLSLLPIFSVLLPVAFQIA